MIWITDLQNSWGRQKRENYYIHRKRECYKRNLESQWKECSNTEVDLSCQQGNRIYKEKKKKRYVIAKGYVWGVSLQARCWDIWQGSLRARQDSKDTVRTSQTGPRESATQEKIHVWFIKRCEVSGFLIIYN